MCARALFTVSFTLLVRCVTVACRIAECDTKMMLLMIIYIHINNIENWFSDDVFASSDAHSQFHLAASSYTLDVQHKRGQIMYDIGADFSLHADLCIRTAPWCVACSVCNKVSFLGHPNLLLFPAAWYYLRAQGFSRGCVAGLRMEAETILFQLEISSILYSLIILFNDP